MIASLPQLLCRVRTATCTDEDIKVLESRIITDDHPGYPHDALHVYARSAGADPGFIRGGLLV